MTSLDIVPSGSKNLSPMSRYFTSLPSSNLAMLELISLIFLLLHREICPSSFIVDCLLSDAFLTSSRFFANLVPLGHGIVERIAFGAGIRCSSVQFAEFQQDGSQFHAVV